MFLWAYNGWGLYLLCDNWFWACSRGPSLSGVWWISGVVPVCQEKPKRQERSECVNCDTLKPKKCVFHTQGIIGEERKSQLIHTWAWLSMSLIQNMFNITALHYVKTSIISHYLLCSDHYAEIMVTSARPLKYSTLFHIRRHSFLRDFTFPFTATEAVNSTKGLSSLD